MPLGEPFWRNNLEKVELSTLFGFIETYAFCPKTIKHPFLPYKEPGSGTLLFPTGHFVGVYFSEELKYALQLGYQIPPLRGYLFDKTTSGSPFESVISSLYELRKQAKIDGAEAMSFIYKLCMNSLYGRFGMDPESQVTEICSFSQELLVKSGFRSADKLDDDVYLVNYTSNIRSLSDEEWRPPRNLAIQISAAITAYARLEMYPFISRDDCFYTDTDSGVLGSPLPEDCISSSELGKFKLEHKVRKGIFLAPKSYSLEVEDDRHIIKQKGPSKNLVTSEWFKRQFADLSRTEDIPTSANFRIDWSNLKIMRKDYRVKLSLPRSNKRESVYNEKKEWVDRKPIEVIDMGSPDATAKLKLQLMEEREKEVAEKEKKMADEDARREKEMEEIERRPRGKKKWSSLQQSFLIPLIPKKKIANSESEIAEKEPESEIAEKEPESQIATREKEISNPKPDE